MRSGDRGGQAVFGNIGSSHVRLSIPVLTLVGTLELALYCDKISLKMALKLNLKKDELISVAVEMGLEIPSKAKIIDLKKLIESSAVYKNDIEFVRSLVENALEKKKAFQIKSVPDELKAEILLNILGERVNNLLTYCNFRLLLCQLRKVNEFRSLCDLIISDKIFETLDRDTMNHIATKQGETYFKPQQLGRECDVYLSARGKVSNNLMSRNSGNGVKTDGRNRLQTVSTWRQERNSSNVFVAETKPNCVLCKGNNFHPLSKCYQFKKLSVEDRVEVVKRNNLCFRCFLPFRLKERRSEKNCFCLRPHNSLIHFSRDKTRNPTPTSNLNLDAPTFVPGQIEGSVEANSQSQFVATGEIEGVHIEPKVDTEVSLCEDHFVRTHRRNCEGRYVVSTALNKDPSCLGNSKDIAIRRLNSWKRLSRDSSYLSLYAEFLKEYEELGHLERVVESSEPPTHYYIPHYGVLRPEKLTTKLRIVFNGSSPTTTGISLNDILLKGEVKEDVFETISRFRRHKFAFTTDIQKIYRQILINPDQQDLQRIIWKHGLDAEILTYRLKTVTYGLSNAPFLAIRTLQQLAKDEKSRFPLASETLLYDTYMDDIVSGAPDLETAQQLQSQLKDALQSCGMNLHKWSSNSPELLNSSLSSDVEHSFSTDIDLSVKTLGISWKPFEDCFAFKVSVSAKHIYTKREEWNHVPSVLNPADLVSRGLRPCDLPNLRLWWHGPQFLEKGKLSSEETSLSPVKECEYSKELKTGSSSDIITSSVCFSTNCVSSILSTLLRKSNSYMKIVRIFSYVLRFSNNVNKRKLTLSGPLSATDIDQAESKLIRMVQEQVFLAEIKSLQSKGVVSPNSKLRNLNPFIDSDGLLRVGGRLSNSDLPYVNKHPAILPGNHNLTLQIIVHFHRKNLHTGASSLLHYVREKFWPLNGRSLCRKVVHECLVCFKSRPLVSSQLMGNLPRDRVVPDYPFNCSGVDFCGPFMIRYKNQRKGILHKIYICVFVCFVSKAIHIEIVSDLTSDAFIATLKDFSRRGKCAKLYSDNGKTFVGANKELKRILKLIEDSDDNLAGFLSAEGIEWKFIPPRAPSFGVVFGKLRLSQ
ncbi:integrase catalytic domain-containing protein [Trichonephila clavipes]|nr:integrase catalytic domain-containing protein [Trichonephila clavipes]